MRHVEAGVLEEDARPATDGFEPVDHLRIDDRAGWPRGCELTWRFAFQHLAAHHDPVEAGLGVQRHAKRVWRWGGDRTLGWSARIPDGQRKLNDPVVPYFLYWARKYEVPI